ncbi:hypothetical protein EV175_000415 [Coemansia sp. RSA 1933]|nr:hypothetical protein EV175_000415 [Coemansia sp. RSA 1933]
MTNSTDAVDPNAVVDLTGDSNSNDSNDAVIEIIATAEKVKDKHDPKIGGAKMKEKKKRMLHRIGKFLRERAMHLEPRDDSTRLQVAHLEWTKEDFQLLGCKERVNDPISSMVVLCNKDTTLFNTTISDRGWACGYRNCQMLLSSLIASASRVSSDSATGEIVSGAASRFPRDKAPQIRALQEMLELAWRDGYDRDGAEQLKHRVMGTRKWIGTTEIYCILAHIGVQAHIVDFHKPTAPDGSHPGLFSWVVEYFTESAQDMASPQVDNGVGLGCRPTRFVAKHPLYLQHQGHSRTIVGIELTDTATNLLLFDPDINVGVDHNDNVRLSRFRFRLRDTRRIPQFQILYVDYDFAALGNAEISRFITSKRVP